MNLSKALFTLVTILFLFGCSKNLVPLKKDYENLMPTSISGKKFNKEEIKKAIVSACLDRGWVPKTQAGVVLASINVRDKHKVKVKITYTETKFNIIYVESENLKENGHDPQ